MELFVTCMYNGLSGTRFGGRLNRNSHYWESLRTIAATGTQVVCYISQGECEQHAAFFADAGVKIDWVILELADLPFSNAVQHIKDASPGEYRDPLEWRERCVEVMWGKFRMLEDAMRRYPAAAHVFWIDAGLAHHTIVSPKYLSRPAGPDRISPEVGLAFPRDLATRLTRFADGRILALKCTVPHNRGLPERFNDHPYRDTDALIGGLFGGARLRLWELCDRFAHKSARVLAERCLFFEESILTGIFADRPELFSTFSFDSWYHEGDPGFNPDRIHFSQFFDLLLKLPVSDPAPNFPRHSDRAANRHTLRMGPMCLVSHLSTWRRAPHGEQRLARLDLPLLLFGSQDQVSQIRPELAHLESVRLFPLDGLSVECPADRWRVLSEAARRNPFLSTSLLWCESPSEAADRSRVGAAMREFDVGSASVPGLTRCPEGHECGNSQDDPAGQSSHDILDYRPPRGWRCFLAAGGG